MGETKRTPITKEQIELIQKQAEGLRYGTLSLVFQDGVLIQIEKKEKMRVQNTDRTKHEK